MDRQAIVVVNMEFLAVFVALKIGVEIGRRQARAAQSRIKTPAPNGFVKLASLLSNSRFVDLALPLDSARLGLKRNAVGERPFEPCPSTPRAKLVIRDELSEPLKAFVLKLA